MRRRVENEDMASLNRHLNAGDKEDTLFLRVGQQVAIEGHLVMIGDGNYVKLFFRGF